MLPVPATHMLFQKFEVYPNQAPIPQVQVHPNLANFVGYISSIAINTVSANAGKNQVRTFMFNLMAQNGWNNQYYADLFHFTCLFIAGMLNDRQYRNIEEAVQLGSTEAPTIYISRLVNEFPELRATLSPQEFNTVMANSQIYARFANYNFNNQQTMMGGSTMYGQQNYGGYNGQGNSFQGGLSGSVGFGSNQQNFNNNVRPSESASNHRTFNAPPTNFGKFAKEHTPEQPQAPVFPVVETVIEYTADDWKSSTDCPYRRMLDEKFWERRYVASGDNIIEVVEPKEGFKNMDRAQHTITLLGNTYSLENVLRRPQLQQSASAMSAITPEDILAATSDGVDPEHRTEIETQIYLSPMIDVYLQSLIFEGRKRQIVSQKASDNPGIFRTYGTVFTPYATKESYRKLLSILAESKSFFQMAETLRKNGQSLSSVAGNSDGKSKQTDDMAIYLAAIDRTLTEHVNSFLKNNLSLTVSIESFTDDVNDLRTYLENKYGARYSRAFDIFQSDMVGNFFVELTAATEDTLTELLDVSEVNQAFSYIPVNYSLTYIDAIPEELDIHLKDGETLMVMETEAEILFKVADTLFKHNTAHVIQPHYNLVITQDNQIYKLFNGSLGESCYLISKA